MAKKFYAVKVGRTPGVYDTWDGCRRQITGFAGALYKGFATEEEALAFAAGDETQETLIETQAIAYVDGSYDPATKTCSYGMVFLHDGHEKHFSKRFDDKKLVKMNNVAGEIKGAEAAMQYCVDNGITSVTIYYDYEGIARWCDGGWKAAKPGTVAYADFYKKASESVRVQFVKVKGHSGDKYNELADKLAKEALPL